MTSGPGQGLKTGASIASYRRGPATLPFRGIPECAPMSSHKQRVPYSVFASDICGWSQGAVKKRPNVSDGRSPLLTYCILQGGVRCEATEADSAPGCFPF